MWSDANKRWTEVQGMGVNCIIFATFLEFFKLKKINKIKNGIKTLGGFLRN